MAEDFLILGHRGSPKRFPENTLASFEEALRAGADGFETDLRLLFDGTAVLYHDDDVDTSQTEALTYEECVNRNVILDHVADLSRFAGRATMVLEVKQGRWEEKLLEFVQSWPGIIVASFDHRVIATLHERGVSFPLGITIHGAIVNVAEYAAAVGASWCFPKYPYVDESVVESLHERGIKVVPWTPNRPELWDRLRSIGCDGVITDCAEEAVRWRDGVGRDTER